MAIHTELVELVQLSRGSDHAQLERPGLSSVGQCHRQCGTVSQAVWDSVTGSSTSKTGYSVVLPSPPHGSATVFTQQARLNLA